MSEIIEGQLRTAAENSELENITIEIIQKETQKEKRNL